MAITFETMFNGLENNFSNLTSRIIKKKIKYLIYLLKWKILKLIWKENTEIKTIQDESRDHS